MEKKCVKQHAQEMQCVKDCSNIDEYFLHFTQSLIDHPITLDEIRGTIRELFPEGKSDQVFYMFAVFERA